VAAGLEYREENFRATSQSIYRSGVQPALTSRDGGRTVKAAFAEIYAPFFTANNSIPGFRLLDLSASVRFDRYSDFGDTVNPKVGLRWSPLGGLTFRGSYGTSFKAPRLNDLLTPSLVQYIGVTTAFGGIDRNADGVLNLVALQGGNPNLTSEKGRAFTIGADFEPAAIPGLLARITYYNISIRDRISTFSDVRGIFSNPDAYAGVIYFPLPSDELVARVIGTPATVLGVPFAPGEVEALINIGRANISSVKTEGLDFDLRYRFDAGGGNVDASVRSTLILGLVNQQSPGLPPLKGFDRIGGPVDLKIRAGAAWTKGDFQLSAYANYVDRYTNTAITPFERVKANVTFDARVSYRSPPGFDLSLSAINLFDKNPPFVDSGSSAFDGTNYSVVGRVIALEIGKKF